jgi:hypothetical protein
LVFGTLIAEVIGSAIFFLFVCVQEGKETKLSESAVTGALFISGMFYLARMYLKSPHAILKVHSHYEQQPL